MCKPSVSNILLLLQDFNCFCPFFVFSFIGPAPDPDSLLGWAPLRRPRTPTRTFPSVSGRWRRSAPGSTTWACTCTTPRWEDTSSWESIYSRWAATIWRPNWASRVVCTGKLINEPPTLSLPSQEHCIFFLPEISVFVRFIQNNVCRKHLILYCVNF